MVTSWNWLLLTDFASFKPTYLPEVPFITIDYGDTKLYPVKSSFIVFEITV